MTLAIHEVADGKLSRQQHGSDQVARRRTRQRRRARHGDRRHCQRSRSAPRPIPLISPMSYLGAGIRPGSRRPSPACGSRCPSAGATRSTRGPHPGPGERGAKTRAREHGHPADAGSDAPVLDRAGIALALWMRRPVLLHPVRGGEGHPPRRALVSVCGSLRLRDHGAGPTCPRPAGPPGIPRRVCPCWTPLDAAGRHARTSRVLRAA